MMILSARLDCNIIVALWFRIVTTLFQHYCPNNVHCEEDVRRHQRFEQVFLIENDDMYSLMLSPT